VIFGADTETFPIRHKQTAPRLVCVSGSERNGDGYNSMVLGNGDKDQKAFVEHLLVSETTWHNASFDTTVLAWNFPDFIPLICAALEEGRIHCTKVREKLSVLSETGNLKFKIFPNGQAMPRKYDLASCVKYHLGKDRSAEKADLPAHKPSEEDYDDEAEKDEDPRGDAWRLNFDAFDGWRADEYPAPARRYVEEDAEDTLGVYECQQERLERNYRNMGLVWRPEVEALHVCAGFYLYAVSSLGVKIDLERVAKFKVALENDLSDDSMAILIAAGVLRPSQPARPYQRVAHVPDCLKDEDCQCPGSPTGAREHVVDCAKRKKGKEWLCGCPLKMKAAEKSSLNTKLLHALITEVCTKHEKPLKLTETGRVSASKEVMEDLAPLHGVLHKYQDRQSIKGLLEREVPRMSADPVHPNYNEIVASFRTSCGATKLYPSGNFQNVDPRARACYPAEDGTWILSVDVNSMELVTLGQTVYDLFGSSTHRDMLNNGMDLHAFMAAQLSFRLKPKFAQFCQDHGFQTYEDRYECFQLLRNGDEEGTKAAETYGLVYVDPEEAKKGEQASVKGWCKEERTFAKPVNLGLPGGLGPDTFVVYALANYGLKVDRETAVAARDTWHEVHPDMKPFFEDLTRNFRDPGNSREETIKATGEVKVVPRYWYVTRLGALRRGVKFTEGVNGRALQSPGAELAKMGWVRICRSAFDHTQGSILFDNCRPMGFVHDEALLYVSNADHVLADNIAKETQRLMVEGGKFAVPDVDLKAGACFQLVWDKFAEPYFNEQGLLSPHEWRPKKTKVLVPA
jgi:hypothetical protein